MKEIKNNKNSEVFTLNTYKNDKLVEQEDIKIFTKINKRTYKKGAFYMTSFEFDKLILEKKYTSLVIRVLTALKLRYDYNNYIKYFTQDMLAREIGSTQQNVSRALNQLRKDKIIIFDEDKKLYYFNEKYLKGNGDTNE